MTILGIRGDKKGVLEGLCVWFA